MLGQLSTFLRFTSFIPGCVYSLQKKELLVIAGPSSTDLAAKIAKALDSELLPANVRIFTDGECKIKMANVKERYCIIVQSIYPPTDRHLLQALMMIKKCADDGATGLCAMIPYMAYARQDRAFLEGEVVSMALVAKLLEDVGTTSLITVDIHSPKALSYFTIKVQNTSSIPVLAEYAKTNMELIKPIVVSPDLGGMRRAEEFAKFLGVDIIALEKSRDRNTGEVFIDEQKLDDTVYGRDTIIIDDIISTGGSIIKATEVLRKKKPGKVYAMCSHALPVGNNIRKIKEAGIEEVIATNSIPSEFAKVDISPALSASIDKLI